ncbi:hypothetical protein NQZ68_029368 [Dissostichus eleginoides]|nr:hypothetical protein NQZ68_029368 [Dissostichus eleginoides]
MEWVSAAVLAGTGLVLGREEGQAEGQAVSSAPSFIKSERGTVGLQTEAWLDSVKTGAFCEVACPTTWSAPTVTLRKLATANRLLPQGLGHFMVEAIVKAHPRRSVKSMSELSGTQPVGALMKVTLLPYREVKLLHLAKTTWGHTACMALEMTVR